MRLSEIITAVRDKVNDPNATYWSNVEIARWINNWSRDLFRQKVDADGSYGARAFDILNTTVARVVQLNANVWVYHLPSWVYKLRRIHVLENNSGAATESEGRPLKRIHGWRPGEGWNFLSNRTIRVQGFQVAPSLRFWVCKIPALIQSGVLQSTSAANNQLIIPAINASLYPVEHEDGAWLGSTIELLTGTSIRDPRGSLSVVSAQTLTWSAGIPIFTLTVEPTYPALPTAADVFEMHCEVEPEHINYLILLVAESLFHKTNNVAGVAGLQAQLGDQKRAFKEGLQPRDVEGTPQVQIEEGDSYAIDHDRDPYWQVQ